MTLTDPVALVTFPPYLPERFDGQRIRNLSITQLETLLGCPERYRRERIRGEFDTPSGEAHLGNCFDRAVELYMHNKIQGQPLSVQDACEAYLLEWERSERKANDRGAPIRFGEKADRADYDTLCHAGINGLQAYLAPGGLGNTFEPIAVQHRLEMKVLPENHQARAQVAGEQAGGANADEPVRVMDHVFWTVVFVLDILARDEHDEIVVIDNKIKRSFVSDPDSNLQATGYLAAKVREGKPASRFAFHTVNYGEPKLEVLEQSTTRTPEQLNAFWLRIAQAARRLDFYSRTYTPEEPWDLAHPGSYRLCNPRTCQFFDVCPGGHGIGDQP
jgi:PD-(D/E)XK nuclease superfamily